MKVVEVPFCFHPDPVGGTEVYVESLSRHLRDCGFEVLIAAPGERDASYTHSGLPVRSFAVSNRVRDLRELYGEGDRSAAQRFTRILDEERPDLVHLHAFTRGVSLALLREAKLRGIPVVFTYHTPTVSCQRGTLLHWGAELCDGVLDMQACSRCTLHGLGLNKATSILVGSLPPAVGRALVNAGLSGGPWTALRMTELVELRHAAFRSFMAEADHIVALCDWTRDLLLRNGVPQKKITMSRQGLSHDGGFHSSNDGRRISDTASSIRVAFLGRLDPTKGLHILIAALRSDSDLPVSLDVYGIVQGEGGIEYRTRLQKLAAGDARIEFCPPLAPEDVAAFLATYDVLAVPSQCLETGPMVVLEAFAAGTPVIGSNLGGIAELVEHEINGLLVEPASVAAWREAIIRISADGELLKRLRSRIRSPRRMQESADDMAALYRSLLEAQCPADGIEAMAAP